MKAADKGPLSFSYRIVAHFMDWDTSRHSHTYARPDNKNSNLDTTSQHIGTTRLQLGIGLGWCEEGDWSGKMMHT